MTTRAQWRQRREEIKRVLAYYATGQMPPPPGNVTGRELKAESVLVGTVRYGLVHLTFGPEKNSRSILAFSRRRAERRFPRSFRKPARRRARPSCHGCRKARARVAGSMCCCPSPSSRNKSPRAGRRNAPPRRRRVTCAPTAETLAERHREIFRRGYALVVFNPNDCAEDTTLREADGSWAFRHTRFPAAYPNYDWGVLAVWAWGASRVADYLATDRHLRGKDIARRFDRYPER